MGSNLYISVERQSIHNNNWFDLFDGPSAALDRGIVVDAFGNEDPEESIGREPGYLSRERWLEMAKHPECPWRRSEPYWVRLIYGAEFSAIVREKRWQQLQDGDFSDLECSPQLRAFAALVESMLKDGICVRVYCWHSQ